MKKRHILFILSIFILINVACSTSLVKSTTDNHEPTDDSYTSEGTPAGNFGTATDLYIRSFGALDRRGYVKFYLDSIENDQILNATVSMYCFYTEGLAPPGSNVEVRGLTNNWSETNITWANAPALGGVEDTQAPVAGSWITWDVTDYVNASYSAGNRTISLGFRMVTESAGVAQIARFTSKENITYVPVLWVEFSNFTYGFSDTYFENGTLYVPPVNVTYSGPGVTGSFNTSGGITKYFTTEPSLFFWSIGTASRRIYSAGESENFTVTYPESVFDTYVFTVRDFTGKTALGDAYLEAWRVINGTDTMIERQIIDVHNEVPLNMVIGATYTIRVRYFDNSIFTWGQFVPGDTTTFTIVLRGVDITDQAYVLGNFLSVDITRPITTQITVDYIATKPTTTWSNVTVLIRNGAVVATQSYAIESFTYNLGGLDANTSYTVLVEGEHSLQQEWAYARTFDGTETYPDVPNIESIFPMGALDGTNLIAWVFTIASGLVFSVIYKRASLIVMCAMASFFSAFGFADWPINLLFLGWFFAIVVYLGSGDR